MPNRSKLPDVISRHSIQAEYNRAESAARSALKAARARRIEQCAKLGHEWTLHQIAGDGRYCKHCLFEDPDFID